TGTDENAVHVSGGNVILNQPTVTRTSAESAGGDDASFYGVGAAILTTDGTSYINGGTITTDANGAAGAFSYGDGITYISGTKIRTSGNTAGGIHVAGGGTLYAYDLDVKTEGESSAAIRSDRGGGTMVVDGGTYVTNGEGSPAVYVTADITINDATLTANGSEVLCLEGLNTVRLFNSNLTSNMKDLEQNDSTWAIILYQSMSGDSEVGNGSFYMIDGSINVENGGLFYSTNTESQFYVENVDITMADDAEYFLRVSGNANQRGWGSTGANGAQTNFTAVNQQMTGNIIWDSVSTLDFYMQDGSVLTGAVIDDETYAGSGGNGYANVYISENSKWIVTGDSVVTNLFNEGTITDEDGKSVTVKGTDGTVYVNGESAYTITVNAYSETADFSGAISSVSYEDYAKEMPEVFSDTEKTEITETEEVVEEEAPEEAINETAETEKTSFPVVPAVLAGLAVLFAGMYFMKKK
ncbi:MAG: hypothetical protein IKR11_04100, partial [Solobacterium sp.]|nr:hypothetical protein [Solobacterium sp.]